MDFLGKWKFSCPNGIKTQDGPARSLVIILCTVFRIPLLLYRLLYKYCIPNILWQYLLWLLFVEILRSLAASFPPVPSDTHFKYITPASRQIYVSRVSRNNEIIPHETSDWHKVFETRWQQYVALLLTFCMAVTESQYLHKARKCIARKTVWYLSRGPTALRVEHMHVKTSWQGI